MCEDVLLIPVQFVGISLDSFDDLGRRTDSHFVAHHAMQAFGFPAKRDMISRIKDAHLRGLACKFIYIKH